MPERWSRLLDRYSRRWGNRPLFVFHIPRTGGTSLRNMLLPAFASRPRRRPLFVDIPQEIDGGVTVGSKDLAHLAATGRLMDFDCVLGHMPFPGELGIERPNIFTVLRDPVERSLSDYWYCRTVQDNPAHRHACTLSPAEFCAGGFSQSQNGQARYLSGLAYKDEVVPDAELLERARRHLGTIRHVGLLRT